MKGQGHRGNPWHDARGRFTTAGNARNACVRGEMVDPQEYAESVKDEDYVDAEKRYYENRKLAKQAYSRGEQALGKKPEEYSSEREYIKAKMKYYEQIDGEDDAQRKQVKAEVEVALANGEPLPVYQDEERTFMKHDYLREKFGDSREEAEKRAKEHITVVDGNGIEHNVTNVVKKTDGNGGAYYEGTVEQTGFSMMITEEQYRSRGESESLEAVYEDKPEFGIRDAFYCKNGEYYHAHYEDAGAGYRKVFEDTIAREEYEEERILLAADDRDYKKASEILEGYPAGSTVEIEPIYSSGGTPRRFEKTENGWIDRKTGEKADAAVFLTNGSLGKEKNLSVSIPKEKKMPWETDSRFAGNKNAKLLWLMANPDSKYNNRDFLQGIKKVQSMADRGASRKSKLETFREVCRKCGIPEDEARHFIAKEFLE